MTEEQYIEYGKKLRKEYRENNKLLKKYTNNFHYLLAFFT